MKYQLNSTSFNTRQIPLIRPLSRGFDSSVGRALHRYRRGRGFESRSEPKFFSGLRSSSVTAALALMTVIPQWMIKNTLILIKIYAEPVNG